MVSTDVGPSIDWEAYKDQLEPFLTYGGIVYVRGSRKAPFRVFDHRLVAEWLPNCPERDWAAVRLSPDDSGTQYRADIVALVAEALSVELPLSQTIDGARILSGNRALISLTRDVQVTLASRRNRDLEITQIKHLVKAIRDLPERQGIALLVSEGHKWEPAQRDRLHDEIWVDQFGALGPRVLLIFSHVKNDFTHEIGSFPPQPSSVIELDDYVKLGGASGDSAILDVARYARSVGWCGTDDAAMHFAEAMVLSCENMSDLYQRLTVYQLNRSRGKSRND